MNAPLRFISTPGFALSVSDLHMHDAYIWGGGRENWVEAMQGGQVILQFHRLQGLPKGAQALKNDLLDVRGQTQLKGVFAQHPWANDVDRVTSDGFDQVQCFYAINSVVQHLIKLGFDIPKVIKAFTPIVANVNAVDDLNAWFNPRSGELAFGTSVKSRYGIECHLASDHDIVRHEFGHLMLHCLNRTLVSSYAGDGGAIHEGFGDLTAALMVMDPHVSELFWVAKGMTPKKSGALRTVANRFKYDELDREVHALGQAYGGWGWGVYEALNKLMKGDGRAAADLVMALLVQHGTYYPTNRPKPVDFLAAMRDGAKVYLQSEQGGKYGVAHARLWKIMKQEALVRNMITPDQAKRIVSGRRKINEDLARLFTRVTGSYPTSFVLDWSTRGTMGGYDFHQQHMRVNDGHWVRLIGSGLHVYTRGSGNEPEKYSTRNVRRDINVDSTFKVDRKEALDLAKAEIESRIAETRAALLAAQDKRRTYLSKRRLRFDDKIDQLERQLQADVRAHEEAQSVDDHRIARLAMLPEGYSGNEFDNELYWPFTFHFTTVYVSAKDGGVIVDQRPMW